MGIELLLPPFTMRIKNIEQGSPSAATGKLARTIFVSDMGDALASKNRAHFDFLEREVITAATSKNGVRHLWLWLTKRPGSCFTAASA